MKLGDRTVTRRGAVVLALLVAGFTLAAVAEAWVALLVAAFVLLVLVADGLTIGGADPYVLTDAHSRQEWRRRLEEERRAAARQRFGARSRGVADDPVGVPDQELWRRERERRGIA